MSSFTKRFYLTLGGNKKKKKNKSTGTEIIFWILTDPDLQLCLKIELSSACYKFERGETCCSRRGKGEHLTLSQSDKWLKQARVLDGRLLTTVDTGHPFLFYKLYIWW